MVVRTSASRSTIDMSSHSPLRRTSRRSGELSRIFSACCLEGGGVGLDLGLAEHRAQGRAARGIAHARGVVADDQHHQVPGVLELAQLAQHHSVAEVDVGRRGVDAELHAQRAALGGGAGSFSASAPGAG